MQNGDHRRRSLPHAVHPRRARGHRRALVVRNSRKQFLKVELPRAPRSGRWSWEGRPKSRRSREQKGGADAGQGKRGGRAAGGRSWSSCSAPPSSSRSRSSTRRARKVAGSAPSRAPAPSRPGGHRSRLDLYLPEALRYGKPRTDLDLADVRQSERCGRWLRRLVARKQIEDQLAGADAPGRGRCRGHRPAPPRVVPDRGAGARGAHGFEKLYASEATDGGRYAIPYRSAMAVWAGTALAMRYRALGAAALGLLGLLARALSPAAFASRAPARSSSSSVFCSMPTRGRWCCWRSASRSTPSRAGSCAGGRRSARTWAHRSRAAQKTEVPDAEGSPLAQGQVS